jgi:hypothetical protein
VNTRGRWDSGGGISMRSVGINKLRHFKLLSLATVLLSAVSVLLLANGANVLAHGGEDHGDQKPAAATTRNGTVSRTVRLGDFEVMLKHALLEPDAAASVRLFITAFATNEPVADANIAAEIESPQGAVTELPVEKTDAAGSYLVKIPALPDGEYTVRAKVTVSDKTDTATFSGVEVGHQEAASPSAGGSSWAQTAMTAFLLLVGVLLFGGLIYLAVRVVKNKPISEEAVAA